MNTKKDYFLSTGGRKSSIAVVKLFLNSKTNIIINGVSINSYFQNNSLILHQINKVLNLIDSPLKYKIFISVKGGGLSGQAQAISLALSKAFRELKPSLQTQLRKSGFLTRDTRIKERRKYGLKKARKASQFSKR